MLALLLAHSTIASYSTFSPRRPNQMRSPSVRNRTTFRISHVPRHPEIVSWISLSRFLSAHAFFRNSTGTSSWPLLTLPQQHPLQTTTLLAILRHAHQNPHGSLDFTWAKHFIIFLLISNNTLILHFTWLMIPCPGHVCHIPFLEGIGGIITATSFPMHKDKNNRFQSNKKYQCNSPFLSSRVLPTASKLVHEIHHS